MEYALRQPALDALTAARGSLILSKKEWYALRRDLKLSPRALQLVRGVFDDQTEEAIADDLSISVHTVHTYFTRLYQKLGVCSREQLLVFTFGRYLQRRRSPKSRSPAKTPSA